MKRLWQEQEPSKPTFLAPPNNLLQIHLCFDNITIWRKQIWYFPCHLFILANSLLFVIYTDARSSLVLQKVCKRRVKVCRHKCTIIVLDSFQARCQNLICPKPVLRGMSDCILVQRPGATTEKLLVIDKMAQMDLLYSIWLINRLIYLWAEWLLLWRQCLCISWLTVPFHFFGNPDQGF